MSGDELISIVQSWKGSLFYNDGKYEIEKNGTVWAEVSGNPTSRSESRKWYESKLWMDIPGPNDYRIVGEDYFNWKFRIERTSTGAFAGSIEQEMLTWNNRYNVIVETGEDDIAILLIAVVLDQVFHKNND